MMMDSTSQLKSDLDGSTTDARALRALANWQTRALSSSCLLNDAPQYRYLVDFVIHPENLKQVPQYHSKRKHIHIQPTIRRMYIHSDFAHVLSYLRHEWLFRRKRNPNRVRLTDITSFFWASRCLFEAFLNNRCHEHDIGCSHLYGFYTNTNDLIGYTMVGCEPWNIAGTRRSGAKRKRQDRHSVHAYVEFFQLFSRWCDQGYGSQCVKLLESYMLSTFGVEKMSLTPSKTSPLFWEKCGYRPALTGPDNDVVVKYMRIV